MRSSVYGLGWTRYRTSVVRLPSDFWSWFGDNFYDGDNHSLYRIQICRLLYVFSSRVLTPLRTGRLLTIIAIALGAVNQARIFGGTIGLAASTIILNTRLANELQGVLSETQLVNLRQSLNYIPSLAPAQQLAVAQTFAKSFNDQLRDCTYVAAACVIISLFTYSKHPTDLIKRKARGEALLAGRITLAEADA